MLGRNFGLLHFSRNSRGTSGNIFENLPAQERVSPSSSGIAVRHGEGLRRDPQSSTTPTPRFSRNPDTWNSTRRTGGSYFSKLYDGNSEVCFLGVAFRKFPDPDDYQCWRDRFKTEVCVSTSIPELTMSWINEVEMAGSKDDPLTSQSTEGKYFS